MRDRNSETYIQGRVAIVLAYSLGLFLTLFLVYAIVEQLWRPDAALSENATQLLSTAIGGIIGVLAGFMGSLDASRRFRTEQKPQEDPQTLDQLEESDDSEGLTGPT
jgi:hypothetical protein